MARLNPEVVVFIIGTNDWTAVSGDWKDDYTAKVDSMMKTLDRLRAAPSTGSAHPRSRTRRWTPRWSQVNAVAQDVAKRHPKVHYVDAYKLFSDADGTFSYDLPDENGKVVTMRAGDGVHFTMDGADYLARQVYKLVDAQCGVTEQKVDGATKQTIETEGSTQVAPSPSVELGQLRLVELVGCSSRRHHPDHAAGDRAADHVAAGRHHARSPIRRRPRSRRRRPPPTTSPQRHRDPLIRKGRR